MLEAILHPSRLPGCLGWVWLSIRPPSRRLHDSVCLIRISHSLCHGVPPVHDGADTAPPLILPCSVIDLWVRLLLHILIVSIVIVGVSPSTWVLILIDFFIFVPVEDLGLGSHDGRVLLDDTPADRLLLVQIVATWGWLEAVGEKVVS